MSGVQFDDLVPGAVVKVPAGAGLRTHTYYLRLTKATPSKVPGAAHIDGITVRADGSPSKRKQGGRRADFVFSIDQLVLISRPDAADPPKSDGDDDEN